MDPNEPEFGSGTLSSEIAACLTGISALNPLRVPQAEQIAGRLPLPVQLPPLHLASADPERSHVVAVSCLKVCSNGSDLLQVKSRHNCLRLCVQASAVHLFDHRLMPTSHPGEVQDVDLQPVAPLWEELSATSRSSLVGTIQVSPLSNPPQHSLLALSCLPPSSHPPFFLPSLPFRPHSLTPLSHRTAAPSWRCVCSAAQHRL